MPMLVDQELKWARIKTAKNVDLSNSIEKTDDAGDALESFIFSIGQNVDVCNFTSRSARVVYSNT